MDTKKKLPSGVLRFLTGYQVKSEDIITYANTDMTLEGEFARGYIILTQHKLIILRSEPDKTEVYQFKGVGSKNELHMRREKNWAAKFISLREIESLEIIRSISGGVLYYSEKKESSEPGPDIQLTAFTNMMIGAVLHIVKLFGILKEKGELTEESMKTEEEDEYCPKCGSMYPDKERKICPKCMDKKSVFFRILVYFKPFTPKLILMILCYIATAALNLVWPYLSGKILYDKILAQNSEFLNSLGIPGINYIVALGLIILVMFLTKITMQVLGIIQGVMTATIVPKIIMKMKSQVFQSMGELSISFFNSRQTGGLMTRVLRDAERVTGFFIDGLPYLMINLLTIIATAIVMFQMNWRLALAALIFVPIIFTISFRLMPKLWHFYGRNNLGVKRIFATCNEKNVASYKVMEKCNMVKIKTENDHKSYRHGEPVTFNRLIYCIER